MAKQGQIDVLVSKQAIEELNLAIKGVKAINDDILTLSKNVRDMNQNLSSVSTPKDLEARLKANEKAREASIKGAEKVRVAELKLQQQREKFSAQEKAFREKQKSSIAQTTKARLRESEAINRNVLSLERQKKSMVEASRAYTQLSAKRLKAKKDLQDLIVRGKTATQTQKQFNAELKVSQSRFDTYDKKIKKADKATKDFGKTVGNYSSALGKAGQAFKAFLPAMGAFTAMQIGTEIFNVVKELDGLNKALKQVTETNDIFIRAKGFLGGLAEEAGVEIASLTKAYTKFLASAKTTNITAEDTENIFRQVAKAGSVLGLSTDDIEGAFKALEQMMSKGTVQAEEIRGQLGERLPGSFQILAKSMGLTTAELGKQLELGNVLAEEVLPKFADELEKTYGLEAVDKVETLTAELNRMSNQWTLLIEEIEGDEGVISGVFSSAASSATTFLQVIRDLNTASTGLGDFFQNMYRYATGSGGAVAMQAEAVRYEKERLGYAEEAYKILVKTTEAESARTLVNNLTTEQLKELIESQRILNGENEDAEEIAKKSGAYMKGSIGYLDEIISANNKLIKQSNDRGTIEKLQKENELIAQQKQLLLQGSRANVSNVQASRVGSAIANDPLSDVSSSVVGGEITNAFGGATLGQELEGFMMDYGDQIAMGIDLTNEFFNNRIARIDEDIAKSNEYYDNQIALAEGNEEQQKRLLQEKIAEEARLNKIKQKEEKKQFYINQATALAEIAINTAVGVSKAVGQTGIFGLAASIPIIALGALQAGVVLSQKPPAYKDGKNANDNYEGVALLNDGGVTEYLENEQGISAIQGRNVYGYVGKKDIIHKDLDSLISDKGYEPEDIYRATVLTSLANEKMLNTKQLERVFDENLKDLDKKILKGVREGFKDVNIHNHTNVDAKWVKFYNDTL